METEPSFISSATTNRSGEISDSSSSSLRTGGPPPSKFKGVVVQPNGHWGAQIYAYHKRIWLGTFKSENEAAMAYDSASIKLRNGPTHRNFPWTPITLHEPTFQDPFTPEDVITMIKNGSYNAKFSDYVRAEQDRKGCYYNNLVPFYDNTRGVKVRQLFQKELTPSDVSKLNRLVIPKKYALKYLPRIPDVDDLELDFFDRSLRSWKLRYCYWKSSQSFVFTRGWNGFAKKKGLRPRDRVIFSSYERGEQTLCMIDVAYHDRMRVPDEGMDLETEFLRNGDKVEEENGSGEIKGNEVNSSVEPVKKGFRLFGVQIE